MSDKGNNGSPFTIIVTAFVALVLLSVMPWGDLTDNRFKDFNLIADLFPVSDKTYITHEEIDPALKDLQADLPDSKPDQSTDTSGTTTDTLAAGVPEASVTPLPEDFSVPVSSDGSVLIEDYSHDKSALRRFANALAQSHSRPVRIAVIGDSYIEGDIFTQDIRSLLQDKYGGSGVGYMAAFSNFPGFRRSVAQSGSGWTEHDIRKSDADGLRPLSGIYYTAEPGAKMSFKGTHRPAHTDSWSRSTIMFISPSDGHITLGGPGDAEQTFDVSASPDVQALHLNGKTSKFTVKTDIAGLKVLGVWLDNPTGIVLDCMSMRGNSGISHRRLNADIARQMRQWADYDLIVLEFGINALSSAQSDYSAYADAMVKVVNTIRSCYPSADILLLGIGDRGQKQGTSVASIATAPAMVRVQRDVARRTGVAFWDMRQAMGGQGAAVDWHNRGLVNADYIHLNHKGGKELAGIFVKSLNLSLSE